ncbi:VCBS repeat-containing protein [Flavobacteriaceae bacterium]|nr:VCBS repeat-containing protein [Flavobacteriaceae bacterium]
MKKSALFLSFLFVVSCTKDPIIYTLTTSANPSDGGTVSPSTQQYDEGKTATIIANASSEYLFQSWSGATGSSNSTSVVMNSDKSVTANFVKKKYALTTTVEGEGTVTEKVIKAGAATDYNSGTIVELTATPSDEWQFMEWTGDLTGSENPTQITIDKAKSVTAVFVKKQYPLTIEIEGEGTVSEKVIKVGLATDYNSGTIVELTAEPTGDWEFVEWTGDITSTENPVQITIDGSKTVKAKFMPYFDYKVPSYIWKNNIQPRFNLQDIEKENGISEEYISNTGSAYADFNGDGYFDIMSQGKAPDGTNVGYDFFINSGDDTFDIDNSFFNSGFKSDKARKTIVGDFNGDNKPDVVRISGGHDYLDNTNITLSKPDGSYVISKIELVPITQYHGFASGDIDNDGDVDLFFGAPKSGFAINDGNANFTWFSVHDKIDNYFKDVVDPDNPTQQDGPYAVQTVEIIDVNKDGNLDIVIGGGYKDAEDDDNLTSPTILWGDGSGNFDYNNKTEVWKLGEKPSYNGKKVDNNDDIVIGDIDGDGINDVVLLYIFQIDNDPNNNGNTTMYSMINVFKGNADKSYTNKTEDWLEDYVKGFPMTWLLLRDVDNNGYIDIVESESKVSRPGNWNGNSNSIRYEWNGSKFDKIN